MPRRALMRPTRPKVNNTGTAPRLPKPRKAATITRDPRHPPSAHQTRWTDDDIPAIIDEKVGLD
jgi:hypothetical protein